MVSKYNEDEKEMDFSSQKKQFKNEQYLQIIHDVQLHPYKMTALQWLDQRCTQL